MESLSTKFEAIHGTRRHHLLHSNEVPLETELAELRAVISKMDVALDRLDDEIDRVYDHLFELQHRRDELLDRRNKTEESVPLFEGFPPSCLAKSFCGRCPCLKTVRRGLASSCSLPTLAVTLIPITYHANMNPGVMYPLPMVETQVELAKAEPQIQVLEYLMEYMSRWEELSIGLTSFLYPILERMGDRLPLLRRFWVEWMSLESQQSAGPITAFQRAPSLLTRYQLDAPWDTHRDILALAPNLVEAYIAVDYDEDDHWPDPRAWTATFCSYQILQYVTFPVLEEIAVEIDPDEVDAISEYLPALNQPILLHTSLPVYLTEFKIMIDNDESPPETTRPIPSGPHVFTQCGANHGRSAPA
ncbi:hypothetical protein R3P38DRAFT_3212460 [Favolaschia claudopus]|uniref:Uncharacterized protein n=1 Tax=Favolaschia claudopus TaxID=2862362 RepID=A0AAW0ADV9_9AGAR